MADKAYRESRKDGNLVFAKEEYIFVNGETDKYNYFCEGKTEDGQECSAKMILQARSKRYSNGNEREYFFSEASKTNQHIYGCPCYIKGSGKPIERIKRLDRTPQRNDISILFDSLNSKNNKNTKTNTSNKSETDDNGNMDPDEKTSPKERDCCSDVKPAKNAHDMYLVLVGQSGADFPYNGETMKGEQLLINSDTYSKYKRGKISLHNCACVIGKAVKMSSIPQEINELYPDNYDRFVLKDPYKTDGSEFKYRNIYYILHFLDRNSETRQNMIKTTKVPFIILGDWKPAVIGKDYISFVCNVASKSFYSHLSHDEISKYEIDNFKYPEDYK